MVRHTVLSLVVLLGSAGLSQAQYYYPDPSRPATAQTARNSNPNWAPTPPLARSLVGRWYDEGSPAAPCYITSSPGSRRLAFTNEYGQTLSGRLLWYGNAVSVYIPGTGRITGQLQGNAIYWSNGAVWAR
jgi:hypothetical protein